MKRLLLILLIMTLLSGCSTRQVETSKMGLEINSYNTSIGSMTADADNQNIQSYKYSIVITNNDLADINIISIEPLLTQPFSDKITEQEITVEVNKTIPSNGMIEVQGEIIFNSGKLSKEEILAMGPFIEDFKIIEERQIKKTIQ